MVTFLPGTPESVLVDPGRQKSLSPRLACLPLALAVEPGCRVASSTNPPLGGMGTTSPSLTPSSITEFMLVSSSPLQRLIHLELLKRPL